MHILALDVGTSSVKAAVLDTESGAPAGVIAKAAYPLDHPAPEAAEIPPGRLWEAVAQAARQATRGWDGIQGVGLSCLTPGLILLDRQDQPLSAIWTHLDRRSRPAARQVWADVGPEFLATTGNRPLPGGITALSWRQQLDIDPYLIRKVGRYLHVNSWLGLVLTGETACDRGNACFTGLYGTLTDQRWSERWCSYFEVDPTWLPSVVCGRTTIGTLRPSVAADLGVPAGIPVKLGTADTSSAILAARMVPGDLLHVVGTTQVLSAFASQPRPDPRRLTRQLGVGDAFIHVTHNPVGGAALDWLRELCFRDQSEADFYGQSISAALERSTTVTLDPPFLGGDRLEIEAHRAAFRGLTLSSNRLDLLAAILQAMARGHRQAMEALGVNGPFARIFLTGGGAEVVRRLLPEYGTSSVYPLVEGSLRGVARLFS
jgi:xylulokinase